MSGFLMVKDRFLDKFPAVKLLICLALGHEMANEIIDARWNRDSKRMSVVAQALKIISLNLISTTA